MKCQVDDIRMFLHVIQELKDPLAVFREALSNSYDAGADFVSIIVTTKSRDEIDIEILDNGKGIDEGEFRYFFGLGFDNKKGRNTIGNKGLGTKLFFNSDKVEVVTYNMNGQQFCARTIKPLDNLRRGKLPEFFIEDNNKYDASSNSGTSVRIIGYKAKSNSPLLSNANIANYLRWYTVAGSCRRLFGKEQGRDFRVELKRCGAEENVSLIQGGHRLPGTENPNVEQYAYFAKEFDPFTLTVRNAAGDRVCEIEIAGSIAGSGGHLVADRRVKKRYKGIFFAKDYFIIDNVNQEVFGGTGEWQNMHIIVNSQDFDLSMSREAFLNTGPGMPYYETINALRAFWNCIRRGERFRYFGEIIETGSVYAGSLYQLLKKLRNEEAGTESENLKAIEILEMSSLPLTRLSDNGGPVFRPNNPISVSLFFQSLVAKGESFRFRCGEIKYRVLSHSNNNGGLLIVQKFQDNIWGDPLFFKPVIDTKDIKSISEIDGIICWRDSAELKDDIETVILSDIPI